MNKLILVGHMAADAKIAQLNDGRSYAFGRIAVKRDFANKNGEYEADFISFKVFSPTKKTEGALPFLKKGQLVALEGAIRTSSRTLEDGTTTYYQEVVIDFDKIQLLGGKKDKHAEETVTDAPEMALEISDDDLPF